jgi:hypothetical protein
VTTAYDEAMDLALAEARAALAAGYSVVIGLQTTGQPAI